MSLRGCATWSVGFAPILCVLSVGPVRAGELIERLHVYAGAQGGVEAEAILHLPAPPAVVQEVLTDYEHWPDLFAVSMRVVRIERHPDRAVTDIVVKHGLLSGERRLLCENRILPEGGLSTMLLAGDFRRYARTWKVSPDAVQHATKADFHLAVDVETWAPGWLMAFVLKQELQDHFVLLKQKVEQRAGNGERP
jgi:ribosome-associated toxin RatA of RatAB toxin-antitoxin module